jgi:hypothetical protein
VLHIVHMGDLVLALDEGFFLNSERSDVNNENCLNGCPIPEQSRLRFRVAVEGGGVSVGATARHNVYRRMYLLWDILTT